MNVLLRPLGLFLLLGASACVQADDSASLASSSAWIRTPAPGSPVMAGYVDLRNAGTQELRFSKITSAAFGAIEIHEMREVGGMMRMRPVQRLVLQPEQRVALKPGGLHLMLFRPVATLQEGETVVLELELDSGERVPIDFQVRDEAP